MPSDTFTNLKTSAVAALCARLVIHPLDNIRVSIQFAPGIHGDTRSKIEHLAKQLSGRLNVLPSIDHGRRNVHGELDTGKRQLCLKELSRKANTALARGLYQGIAFTSFFQVPGLALFLTTYDTCKHGLHKLIDVYAPELDGLFLPNNTETHLLSGMLAKSSGNLIWSPMIRIQSMQQTLTGGPSQVPVSIRQALSAVRYILETEGLAGLWSGYLKNVGTLLPYTMIYFGTYEQLKQTARWLHSFDIKRSFEKLLHCFNGDIEQIVASITRSIAYFFRGPSHMSQNKDVEFWKGWWEDLKNSRTTIPSPMPLPAYMACVSGSVVFSATVCHVSTGVLKIVQERFHSSATAAKAPAPISMAITKPIKATNNVQMYPSKTALQLQSGSSILFPTKRRPSLTSTTVPASSGLAGLGLVASSVYSSPTANARSTAPCSRPGITSIPATKWSGMTISSALRLHHIIPFQLKQMLTSNKNAHNVRSATFGMLSGMPWPRSYQHATITTASVQSFTSRIHPITKQPQLGSALRPTVAPSIPYPPPSPAMASRFAASLGPASTTSSATPCPSSSSNPGTAFQSLKRIACTNSSPLMTCYDTLNDMKTPSPSSLMNQPKSMPMPIMNTTSPLGPAPTTYAPSQATQPATLYVTSTSANNPSALWRTLMRGLGSRILWTVPGVTLTTAGFEVLRHLAQK
ncbi:hypothetical protein BGW42_004585 [Actinomortierella wolfii]|nr:hypothetical protein BGW42_004585 [Actinomortierella wolfii]